MAVKNWTDIERDVIAEFLQRQYQALVGGQRHNWTEDAEMLQRAIGGSLLARADEASGNVPVLRVETVEPAPRKRLRFL